MIRIRVAKIERAKIKDIRQKIKDYVPKTKVERQKTHDEVRTSRHLSCTSKLGNL